MVSVPPFWSHNISVNGLLALVSKIKYKKFIQRTSQFHQVCLNFEIVSLFDTNKLMKSLNAISFNYSTIKREVKYRNKRYVTLLTQGSYICRKKNLSYQNSEKVTNFFRFI